MLFSRFFKLVSLAILVVLTSCHSSHEQSFQQLESALVSWYYKYHPTIANEKYITIYNSQIEKNDINSIEEYKADINRFMIELSQIDERKLNKNTLVNYVATNQFLFQKYNDILITYF